MGSPLLASATNRKNRKMTLTPAQIDLILAGLDSVADQAQYDANSGGSDEPDVARKIAWEASDLRRALARFSNGATLTE